MLVQAAGSIALSCRCGLFGDGGDGDDDDDDAVAVPSCLPCSYFPRLYSGSKRLGQKVG